jgi:hypothetical protein
MEARSSRDGTARPISSNRRQQASISAMSSRTYDLKLGLK